MEGLRYDRNRAALGFKSVLSLTQSLRHKGTPPPSPEVCNINDIYAGKVSVSTVSRLRAGLVTGESLFKSLQSQWLFFAPSLKRPH